MHKPVIFYQFDQKDFFSRHYASSGNAYPFGRTFENEDAVVREILSCMGRKCMMEQKFRKEVDGFFEFRDSNNCSRNYKMIIGL